VLFAVDLHDDFVNEESVAAVASMPPPKLLSVSGSKLDIPEPDGLVADSDASFTQEACDVAVAQVESVVQQDGIADNFAMESVTFVGIHH
jgi:hypothetical protein